MKETSYEQRRTTRTTDHFAIINTCPHGYQVLHQPTILNLADFLRVNTHLLLLYPTLALRPFDVAEHKRKAKRINEVETEK